MLSEEQYLQQWQKHFSTATDNLQLALSGGRLATNVAQIFVAGYQACIRQIFSEIKTQEWLSFAVSEAKGDETRPGVNWQLQDNSLTLSGYKTWIAASGHVGQLVIKAGRGADAIYVLVPRSLVKISHKENPSLLPELSQGEAQLVDVCLPSSKQLDAEHVHLFGQYEAIFILFATVGFVQAQVGSSTPAIETLLNESAALWGTHVSKHKPLEQLGKFKKGVMSLWQPYTDLNGSALIKRYAQAN